jgi:WD40 repeat protein
MSAEREDVRHSGSVTACVFSADGERLATASEDATLRVRDARSGAVLATGRASGAARSCAFSGDGASVVSGWDDGALRVHDAATGADAATLLGHSGPVRACATSADGARIASGSDDGTLRLWDPAAHPIVTVLADHGRAVAGCRLRADGRVVLSWCVEGPAQLRDVETGAETALEGGPGGVVAAAFSPDGRQVLVASRGAGLAVCDARTGAALARMAEPAAEIRSAQWRPDGRALVFGTVGGELGIWEVATPAARVLEAQPRAIDECLVSPDATWLVSRSADRTVRLWDMGRGTCTAVFAPGPAISALAVSPSGRRIAVGDAAGGVHLLTPPPATRGTPLVTGAFLYRAPERGFEREPTLACPWCARRWLAPAAVVDAVREATRDEIRAWEIPAEAWRAAALVAACPACHETVRFNPYFLDGRGDVPGADARSVDVGEGVARQAVLEPDPLGETIVPARAAPTPTVPIPAVPVPEAPAAPPSASLLGRLFRGVFGSK